MGKYMRKGKGIGEIAVMELAQVGVRTRARALAMAAASSGTAKRRKVDGGELSFTPSLVQLRSRSRIAVTPENTVSPATSENSRRRTVANDRCSSPSSDHVKTSCCSSNGSSSLAKESLKFVDLEEESVEIETFTYNFNCRKSRRETTPSSERQDESDDLESTARPSDANSRRRSSVEKMPSETELEEFFAATEKDHLLVEKL
uniref:Cyclin-dependent kinase inhibitor n=1 Tax=Davidia involucrata TaxID=16924 RepID=A0A5B7AB37_DAVIN